MKSTMIGAFGQCIGFSLACISLIVKQFFVYNWTVTFFIIVLIFAVLQTGIQGFSLKKQLRDMEIAEKRLSSIINNEVQKNV